MARKPSKRDVEAMARAMLEEWCRSHASLFVESAWQGASEPTRIAYRAVAARLLANPPAAMRAACRRLDEQDADAEPYTRRKETAP